MQSSPARTCVSKRRWSEALPLLKKRSEFSGVLFPQENTSSVNSDLRRGSSPEEETETNVQHAIELPMASEPELPMAEEPMMSVAGESELPMFGEPEVPVGTVSEEVSSCNDAIHNGTVDEAELLSDNQGNKLLSYQHLRQVNKI
ncbi:hypothetical protein V6N13_089745 [Hibiscus sabdariffa]|uniref:Uncharacterized protein n=1 Tax=Hibiscus sabdariffa TaxID=183260 RepID=A0ABR2QIW1_9ROSI